MLPTPSTSHVSYDRIYEPSEDSFFLIDAISSPSESAFLQNRFNATSEPLSGPVPKQPSSSADDENSNGHSKATGPSPLIVEVGTGSGVVLAFLTAHAKSIFGRSDILTMGTDINHFAASAANKTVRIACADARAKWPTYLPTPPSSCPSPNRSDENGLSNKDADGPQETVAVPTEHDSITATPSISTSPPSSSLHGTLLTTLTASLTTPFRPNTISILLFNPPYVPSETVPPPPPHSPPSTTHFTKPLASDPTIAEQASHLLALATDGGHDGMDVTWRFLAEVRRVLEKERGVAYVLLCKQNRPEVVMKSVMEWNEECGEHGATDGSEHAGSIGETESGDGGPSGGGSDSGRREYIWDVEMIAKSGYVAGWEKLCILRMWRKKVGN